MTLIGQIIYNDTHQPLSLFWTLTMNNLEIDSKILLSLLTPPFLVGIAVIRGIEQGLSQIGEMSEEIFRGERLPLLNVPNEALSDEKDVFTDS